MIWACSLPRRAGLGVQFVQAALSGFVHVTGGHGWLEAPRMSACPEGGSDAYAGFARGVARGGGRCWSGGCRGGPGCVTCGGRDGVSSRRTFTSQWAAH